VNVYGLDMSQDAFAALDEQRRERTASLEAAGLPPARVYALSQLDSGTYSVVLSGVRASHSLPKLHSLLKGLGYFDQPDHVLDRAVHIQPEPVAINVSERVAIGLKKLIESAGGRAEIRGASDVQFRRPAISADTRREVWRRDEGQCVRCGSRESLEFHHIIPLSRGGSNTTRNIELLCETCHRPLGNRL
jgi:hypothetical protein